MNDKDIESKLKEIFIQALNIDVDPQVLTRDEPIIDNGILDSILVLNLVAGVELEFGFEIDDDELNETILISIGTLAEFVEQKLKATSI